MYLLLWGTEMQKQEVNKYLEYLFGLRLENEAGQKLTEFLKENTLVIVNTLFQQHNRKLYIWTSPDGQHQNLIDFVLCSWRWRSTIQSSKTRPGGDCGSDHELLIAKFRPKWKKVGENTTTFSGVVIWFRPYLNGPVVFLTFSNLSLNLVIRSSWSEPQSPPGLVFVDCIELLHLWLQII